MITILGSNSIAPDVVLGPYCIVGCANYHLRNKGGSFVVDVCPQGSVTIGSGGYVFGLSVICVGAHIGPNFRADFHSFVGERTTIGERCTVEHGARIYDDVLIGDCSTIGGFVCNGARIGARVVVQGALVHSYKDERPNVDEPAPILEDDVVIGHGAVVIGGVLVARGSYVGAGSVVTKSTRPGRLYLGIPAIEVGDAPIIKR